MSPDWLAVERAYGVAVPEPLRALYADADTLAQMDFIVRNPGVVGVEGEWDVAGFQPADPDPIDLAWVGAPARSFCFAMTLTGDPYYVTLGQAPDGGPVYVAFHDGGEIEQVAPNLATFLSWPRQRRQVGPE